MSIDPRNTPWQHSPGIIARQNDAFLAIWPGDLYPIPCLTHGEAERYLLRRKWGAEQFFYAEKG